MRLCVQGAAETDGQGSSVLAEPPSDARRCLILAFCSTGLLVSYLLWGLLQERIMAFEYIPHSALDSVSAVQGSNLTDAQSEESSRILRTPQGERFKNSLFLEFMNRILAVFIAAAILLVRKQPKHTAPIYKYSFNAFSNVMSSWFQYEALKYVSFPVQVNYWHF